MAWSGSRAVRHKQIRQIHAGPAMPGRAPHRVHHEPGGRLRGCSVSTTAGIPAGLATLVTAGRRSRTVGAQPGRLAPRAEVRRAGRGILGAALARLAVGARRMLPAPRAQLRRGAVVVQRPVSVRIDDGPTGPLGRGIERGAGSADQVVRGGYALQPAAFDFDGGETHGISARSGGGSRADPPLL